MKVLFIYYRYPLYPQGSYFLEFLNKIASSCQKIYLVACYYPKSNFKRPKNLKIFWIPLVNIPFVGELFFIFAALLKVVFTKEHHQVDVVNSIGPRGVLAGWYLKKRYKIPLICTIEMFNPRKRAIDKMVYFLSHQILTKAPIDQFICWSNYYWQNHLKKWGIGQKKVTIIPAGIDIKAYRPKIDGRRIKKKYAPRSPLLVFAKPLSSEANTESACLLVRSLTLLKPKIKVKLLVGSGEGKVKVWALAKKLGVVNQIDFIPPTPFPKIPEYLAAADLIVLPFTYPATTSRSLLEALAMGKPTITTPTGEIKQMLKPKHHAFLVKNQPEALAQAIKTLIKNKNLAKNLGRHGRQFIVNYYSLKSIVKYTLDCFNQVVPKTKVARRLRRF